MDVCHLFSQCMLAIIPLIGGVTGVVVTRACTGYLVDFSCLYGFHCPVMGRVVGVETPRYFSELQF